MTSSGITNKPLSRREFLRMGSLAVAAVAALVVGCRPSTTNETASAAGSQTNAVATATAIVQPSAMSSQAAVATATPAAQQSAGSSQAAVATATPAAQQKVYVACPFGLVDDPFPGRCKRYRDSNGNRYCDLSVPGSGNMPARGG